MSLAFKHFGFMTVTNINTAPFSIHLSLDEVLFYANYLSSFSYIFENRNLMLHLCTRFVEDSHT